MANGQDSELKEIAEELFSEADALKKLARPFQRRVDGLSAEDKKKDLDEIGLTLMRINGFYHQARAKLAGTDTSLEGQPEARERSIVDSTPEGTNFADFLANIGTSFIETQQKLDQQSIEYLNSIQDRPYLPPTVFRIPKISAELNVALEEKKGMGVNVILFSKQQEMSTYNQQSMNFEIAAVPPSPELLQILRDQTPKIDFLFDTMKRQSVFDQIEKLTPQQNNPKLKAQLQIIATQDNRNRVLIWPIGANGTFLILFAGEASGDDVGIWFLNTQKEDLEPVLRLDLKPKPGENQGPLREFVFELGQTQEKLLGSL